MQPNPPAPGRPRDPAVERRILEAALRQLAAAGYSRMSVDAVAREAGVGKPAIYRRWAGKADLATAALTLLRLAEPPPARGGSLETLEAALRNFRASLLRPHGMALIGTVLAEEGHTPELLDLFRRRLVEPRRAILREILQRARAAGELPPAADIDAAVNMMVGSLYARYLEGKPLPPAWCARVAALAWRGMGGRGSPRPRAK